LVVLNLVLVQTFLATLTGIYTMFPFIWSLYYKFPISNPLVTFLTDSETSNPQDLASKATCFASSSLQDENSYLRFLFMFPSVSISPANTYSLYSKVEK